MALTSILGLIAGIGLFLTAIFLETDNYLLFVSASSLLMVLGGTIANAFLSFQPRYVKGAFKAIGKMFTHAKYEQELIVTESQRIVGWAKKVRRDGLLALEDEFTGDQDHDYMLKFGMGLLVDGDKPDRVRELLDNVVASTFNRVLPVVDVLKTMASSSPAFGMMGTLVGLVVMLDNMSENPDALGSGLALAMITTLYGVIFARLLFQPAADKTLQRGYIERFRNNLVVECLVQLSTEASPREVEAQILSLIDPLHAPRIEKGGDE